MSSTIATLSSAGWVSGVAETADRLIAYFLYADKSQTEFYPSVVYSLPYLIQQNGSNPLELERSVKSAISTYLQPYFDQIEATVTTDQPTTDDPNRINLSIDLMVAKGTVSYSLGRLIQILNGRVVDIINRNNQ